MAFDGGFIEAEKAGQVPVDVDRAVAVTGLNPTKSRELRPLELFARNTCLSWRVVSCSLAPYLYPDLYTNTPQLSSCDKMRHPRVFQGLFPA